MNSLPQNGGIGKPLLPSLPVWNPPSPADIGSYRRHWLSRHFGMCPELAAVLAELQFQPTRRRA
jgi:hypothetical protein